MTKIIKVTPIDTKDLIGFEMDLMGEVSRRVASLQDQVVRQQLEKAGWLSPEAAAALRAQVEALSKPAIQYTPGEWFQAASVDEMQAFFESRLPAIREAARAHGYAIGVHGSMRRDLDLIAAPWRDGAADAETLAHAVAKAACGIDRNGAYNWEQKPVGRIATSLPICWVDNGVDGAGHIDLSVVPQPLTRPAVPEGWKPTDEQILEAVKNWGDFEMGHNGNGGERIRVSFPVPVRAFHFAKELLAAAPQPEVKPQRPQNCGTGYCSCIECVMEPEAQPTEAAQPIDLVVIREWPEGFEARLQHVWKDVIGFIPNVKLWDLQRVLAEFGFTMTVTEQKGGA